MGKEPRFEGGRRVTQDDEIDLVRMVLSGSANKRMVSLLAAAGLRAVGVSGEDGGLLRAHVAPGAPMGRVGERISAHPMLVQDLLATGWLPVVSPLGTDADALDHRALNLNGDDAATALAIGLRASELLLVADVPGVLVDGLPTAALQYEDALELIERGVAAGGMAAKLQAGYHALAHGVGRVRIGDLSTLADPARGTVLLPPGTLAH
jgi:acetylglutamate kinase